ncbi:MAG: hypothetical protein IPP96_17645 [Chitinophagaceae bacterium]|nr:hypothetical protein [Chitinophagaceae bacterium]
MEDRFLKYSKLYALIFLLFLSVPVIIGLAIFFFWGFSKLVSSSIVDVIFGLGIITIPPALFSTVHLIFYKRTKRHPAVWVRYISYPFFAVGIVFSIYVLMTDLIAFFSYYSTDIASYNCYSLIYMAGNIAGLFIIALMQAFTTNKEVDWMDRHR